MGMAVDDGGDRLVADLTGEIQYPLPLDNVVASVKDDQPGIAFNNCRVDEIVSGERPYTFRHLNDPGLDCLGERIVFGELTVNHAAIFHGGMGNWLAVVDALGIGKIACLGRSTEAADQTERDGAVFEVSNYGFHDDYLPVGSVRVRTRWAMTRRARGWSPGYLRVFPRRWPVHRKCSSGS